MPAVGGTAALLKAKTNMTSYTQHARDRIEEYRIIDNRRRAVYQPGSRKLPGACDRAERRNYDPSTLRVGQVESPAHHTDIHCAHVRDILPLIEDLHFDPLFDGWSDDYYSKKSKLDFSLTPPNEEG